MPIESLLHSMTRANRAPNIVLVTFVKEAGTDGNVGLFVHRRGARQMHEALYQKTLTGSGHEFRRGVQEALDRITDSVNASLDGRLDIKSCSDLAWWDSLFSFEDKDATTIRFSRREIGAMLVHLKMQPNGDVWWKEFLRMARARTPDFMKVMINSMIDMHPEVIIELIVCFRGTASVQNAKTGLPILNGIYW